MFNLNYDKACALTSETELLTKHLHSHRMMKKIAPPFPRLSTGQF